MGLLSKTESSSFNSFLDTVDDMDYENGYVSREWAMYAQHQEAEQYHDKTALTKATKDLMALDARAYGHHQHQQQLYYPGHPPQQQQQPPQPYSSHYDYHPGPVYTRQPTFPFLHQQRAPPPPPHPLNMNYTSPRPYATTPSTGSTSSSSFSFPPDLPPSPVVERLSPERPSPKHTQSAPAMVVQPPAKRPRTAPPPAKPALLSASQKKANHIQSEQKRRANIRRGYEALCDVVPSLRDAIREEEALQNPPSANSKGKRGRGRGRGDDGEKVDGRAGPRSENVVLTKSRFASSRILVEVIYLLRRSY
ncbi:BHLH domain-containing protein [Favolaschia claudopus]|uniref:BHLH domain-containing protein n=1 Tax=Favolaschia claudopus TaxID=2862362 RepID=A0AAW0C443_9AGAR